MRTALAVSLLSLLTWWLPKAITVQQIDGVLAGALWAGNLRRLGLSVLAVGAINLVLVYNHRKGRYHHTVH